jgi:hypothetical protein
MVRAMYFTSLRIGITTEIFSVGFKTNPQVSLQGGPGRAVVASMGNQIDRKLSTSNRLVKNLVYVRFFG